MVVPRSDRKPSGGASNGPVHRQFHTLSRNRKAPRYAPHEFTEILVLPVSVTPQISDLLMPVSAGGKFYAKLYEMASYGACRWATCASGSGMSDPTAARIAIPAR
jgi:hypothetical protein